MKWYPSFLILLTFHYLTLPSCFINHVASLNTTVKCIDKERQALLEFKHGIIRADHCKMLINSWNDDQEEEQSDCCTWVGVRCNKQTGHVIGLHLSGCDHKSSPGCLEGNIISPSLVELKHLKYLDLSCNGLTQNIPSFIGSLVNLEHLNLSNNYFYGQVPHQLSNLSRLTSLDLSYDPDYRDGGFYVENLSWLSQLTLLRDINLRSVDLSQATDWLQIISGLSFLTTLQMEFCDLYSRVPLLPLSYVNSSTTLSVLNLSYNNLSDSSVIFGWLSNLTGISTSLRHIEFGGNGVAGPIPDMVGKFHSLSYLDLSHNKLEGVVPGSIFNLKHLEYLDLARNKLQGVQTSNSSGGLCNLETMDIWQNNITSTFSSLLQVFSGCVHKSLVYMDVGENRFWGSIPNEIGTFSSLQMLNLGDNQLDGEVSSSLRLPLVLESLDLHSNSLKGEFSIYHLSNLSSLSYLDLSSNPELVVRIPLDWVPPFQLDHLWLSSCNVGPQFPRWLQTTHTTLEVLDLSNTGISDTIPTAFWNMFSSNIQYLNLSHNEISGVLPFPSRSNFTFESYIVVVDMSWNHMEGAIPSFLGNAAQLLLNNNNFSGSIAPLCQKTKANLQILDASNNFFSGELPDCWEHFQYLQILLLDNNNFTAELPPSIGTLSDLNWLSMRNNNLHGELQILSANMPSLTVLDLGHNSFTGHIPDSIGAKGITILDLGKNKLSGRLPLSLCNMTELKVLDLSLNRISGTFPECICNLNQMTTSYEGDFYLSVWQANTSLTEMIMWKRKERSFSKINLVRVRSIAMSDNELEGTIPSQISCLRALKSLDLARNRFAGSVPPGIGEMKSLEFLDLSSNNLSGEIPSSLANLNFLGTLNLSYNKLSGRIPMGTQIQSMDPTSYMGNLRLCGTPLPKCGDGPTFGVIPKGQGMTPEEESDGKSIYTGLYVSVVMGFIVGFWGVCGTLVIKTSWRRIYFRFVEETYFRIWKRQQ